MKKYSILFIVINLVLLLGYFNYSVANKEKILNDGQLVLLKLDPVDPRSLLQGDYMNLRYELSDSIHYQELPSRGYCVVRLDNKNRGTKVRFQEHEKVLNKGEVLIKYTMPETWRINIGAESYFFQEGKAELYANAVYGGLRIDKKGNSLLVGLYDKDLKKIE